AASTDSPSTTDGPVTTDAPPTTDPATTTTVPTATTSPAVLVTPTVAPVPANVIDLGNQGPSTALTPVVDSTAALLVTSLEIVTSGGVSPDFAKTLVQTTALISRDGKPFSFNASTVTPDSTGEFVNRAVLQVTAAGYKFAKNPSSFVLYDDVSINASSILYSTVTTGFATSFRLANNVTELWYALSLLQSSTVVHIDIFSGKQPLGSFNVDITPLGRKKRDDATFVITSGTDKVRADAGNNVVTTGTSSTVSIVSTATASSASASSSTSISAIASASTSASTSAPVSATATKPVVKVVTTTTAIVQQQTPTADGKPATGSAVPSYVVPPSVPTTSFIYGGGVAPTGSNDSKYTPIAKPTINVSGATSTAISIVAVAMSALFLF
ncbi:hypothetical protein HDU99_001139, partial [Rhizoclosmatium hyalinum]